ncbi:hypothetical protein CBM2634_B60231 [Cupriavidus taiwanensis]|uniref:Uncharacterized protein n=1 Tax=Cupriavidus taiwanensis TaxID=164546 RepID=A0A375J9E8_9BURK|nr:hypothetical protein CBM2634_B60231 [Cupriavidus taiwanensis]
MRHARFRCAEVKPCSTARPFEAGRLQDLPRAWRAGKDSAPALRPIVWTNKPLASLANMAAVKFQLRKLSRGKATNPKVSPLCALILQQASDACRARQYRRWIAQRRSG